MNWGLMLLSTFSCAHLLFVCKVGFPGSSVGKESACNAGDPVRFLSQEDPLEEG